MKTFLCVLGLFASLSIGSAQSSFTANLSAQAGVTTSGTGTGTFTLSGSTLSYDITYQNLSGTPNNAHIHTHLGGGIVNGITANGALGTSGRYMGTATYNATQIADLQAGRFYVNIHSGLAPGGEIFGTIVPVPEPGTIAVAALGLATIVLSARRKK